MIRHGFINVGKRCVIADIRLVAERDVADIFIEGVLMRIAVPVGFISAHRVFIPLAGKNALPADGFEPPADTADTGEQIDKAERIVRVMRRRRRQQRGQPGRLVRMKPISRILLQLSLQMRAVPFLNACVIQHLQHRFGIVDLA